ncbi:MAG: glycosyltransferase family 2 protein [Rhodoglobus sp.]
MKIVMTLMIRDEADIIQAMLEHHAAQGISTFVITDNGSTDGTVKLIEEFAEHHDVDLRHDAEHRKQQGATVTRMARDAYSLHGADWVINADSDEFWLPVDRSRTLAEVVAEIPPSIQSFPVPVTDMTGEPAEMGTGISRLIYRDLRPVANLNDAGIFAHSTPNVLHVGNPDVEVVQGNHFVNMEVGELPDPRLGIEVLHFPWRSWAQFRRKVENAGRAYDANPNLTPSPNHHGMRDYRRLQHGTLLASYIMRHPDSEQLAYGLERSWFVLDETFTRSSLPGIADIPLNPDQIATQRAFGGILHTLEESAREAENTRIALHSELAQVREHNADLEENLHAYRSRRVVRAIDTLNGFRHKLMAR